MNIIELLFPCVNVFILLHLLVVTHRLSVVRFKLHGYYVLGS